MLLWQSVWDLLWGVRWWVWRIHACIHAYTYTHMHACIQFSQSLILCLSQSKSESTGQNWSCHSNIHGQLWTHIYKYINLKYFTKKDTIFCLSFCPTKDNPLRNKYMKCMHIHTYIHTWNMYVTNKYTQEYACREFQWGLRTLTPHIHDHVKTYAHVTFYTKHRVKRPKLCIFLSIMQYEHTYT